MNEFSSVLQFYKTDPAKNCAADDNGEVYEAKEFLDEYEWIMVSQLDAALRPVGPFIATMEASEKVTCSLVIPMTLAIIHATSKDVPMLCYNYEYGELSESFVEHDDICEDVRLVREKLHNENKQRFVEKERIGNYEDNLICTLLDPRFKLMNFNGSTVEMKRDAEKYLKENYKANWSHQAKAVESDEAQAPTPSTAGGNTSAQARTTTPSTLPKSPTIVKKKKVFFYFDHFLSCVLHMRSVYVYFPYVSTKNFFFPNLK